jgi:hypothetical protein
VAKYKDMTVPSKLVDVIEHMKDVDSYREELTILGQAWDLLTILGRMSGGRTDMTSTREDFRQLTEKLITSLGHETLSKTVLDITAKAQVAVDIIIRNLFERTADIGFLATDDDTRDFIRNAVMKSKLGLSQIPMRQQPSFSVFKSMSRNIRSITTSFCSIQRVMYSFN